MATAENIFPSVSAPGVQRDGTQFDSDRYIDGQWCRFSGEKARPQKMGGYEKMFEFEGNVPRGAFVVSTTPLATVYVGDSDILNAYSVDKNTGMQNGVVVDRTPILFTTNPYNQWSFDIMTQGQGGPSIILAMATRNLYSVYQDTETPIYYGRIDSNDPLIETGIYGS